MSCVSHINKKAIIKHILYKSNLSAFEPCFNIQIFCNIIDGFCLEVHMHSKQQIILSWAYKKLYPGGFFILNF